MLYAMVTVNYLENDEVEHTFNDLGEAIKFVKFVEASPICDIVNGYFIRFICPACDDVHAMEIS